MNECYTINQLSFHASSVMENLNLIRYKRLFLPMSKGVPDIQTNLLCNVYPCVAENPTCRKK
jgi:hypothetical protein